MSHLLGISGLRSLLLEHTQLSEEDALTLDQLFGDLAARAIGWGVEAGHCRIASLQYRWDRESVVFALYDHSGWFVTDSRVIPMPWEA